MSERRTAEAREAMKELRCAYRRTVGSHVVEAQIIGSLKDGTHNIREGLTIKVATVGSFPEILEQPNAGS